MSAPRAARRAGAALAALLLVALVTLVASLDRPAETTPRSVASAADDGRRALFLLLESLGLEPRAWRQRPGLLPRGRHVLVLPAVPGGAGAPAPTQDERDRQDEATRPPEPDPLDLAVASGLRSPRHYRGFVEQGGTLVAPLDDAMLAFLADEVGLIELAGARAVALEPAPTGATLADGERLELALEAPRALFGLDPAVPREPLAASPEGAPLALELPVGRGGLVLLGDAAFLDNERLRKADNALLAVRLVEALRRDGALYFDEYALGRGAEVSRASLALQPDTVLLSVHASVLLLLAFWALAWPREFPRDPARLHQVAPLARVRAQAGLVRRAGRTEVLASMLRAATLRRLMQRARLVPSADEPLEVELERLAPFARSVGGEEAAARWREALVERRVRDDGALARLDRDLRTLEVEAGCGARALSHQEAGPVNA